MVTYRIEFLEKVLTAVEELNSFAWEEASDIEPLTMESDGCIVSIKYFGDVIWRSDSDERGWEEETDDYEDLKGYMIKKIIEKNSDILIVINKFQKMGRE